jgi:hypothetical protein
MPEVEISSPNRPTKLGGKLTDIALCSDCFQDRGLHLDAKQIGVADDSTCPSCGSSTGRKLNPELIKELAYRFFVRGTLNRRDYGAAPSSRVQRATVNVHRHVSVV